MGIERAANTNSPDSIACTVCFPSLGAVFFPLGNLRNLVEPDWARSVRSGPYGETGPRNPGLHRMAVQHYWGMFNAMHSERNRLTP